MNQSDRIDPQWRYVASTHPGRVFEQNQDAVLIEDRVRQGRWRSSGALAPGALVAIADGVANSSAPARAAREVLAGLAESYAKDPQARPRVHAEHIHEHLARQAGGGRLGMSSTLVAAILRQQAATVLHCGDSRAYLLDQSGIRPLTRDHTVLQRMLDEGEITLEQAENAASLYSALDRCFVADPLDEPPTLALAEIAVPPGARLLLCSDGVTESLSDRELERLLCDDTPLEQAAEPLQDAILKGNGDDNLSFVVLQCAATASESTAQG